MYTANYFIKRNGIKETDVAGFLNAFTLNDYLDRLRILATSLFYWEGLDDLAGYGASRFLEQNLYDYGRACIVKDDELGFLSLRANPDDKLNVYNLPVRVMATGANGYNKSYPLDDIIYIMNNELEKPTRETIDLFARRLYETERTIDVNLIAQKTPVLIEGDTKSILTLKNVYMQYSGNIPFIFGNKQFDISNRLNVLKTDAPYLVDKLELHKHELWNEALTFLGIDNANTDKKERLITDEVESNDELIRYYLNCFYKTRKDACERLNEKFGTNIDIKLSDDVKDLLDEFININFDENINETEDNESGEYNG